MGRKTQFWPKCEVCNELAVQQVQDVCEGKPRVGPWRDPVTGQVKQQAFQTFAADGEPHWFCKAHRRAPLTRGKTNEQRCRELAEVT